MTRNDLLAKLDVIQFGSGFITSDGTLWEHSEDPSVEYGTYVPDVRHREYWSSMWRIRAASEVHGS